MFRPKQWMRLLLSLNYPVRMFEESRHSIRCTTSSCNLCGAEDVLKAFLKETGTALGEISLDGNFSVIEAECLAGCGFPTCVQINSKYFENVESQDVGELLRTLVAELSIDSVKEKGDE
jgi:NADH:ubiquinone oxidoreductase subunit E